MESARSANFSSVRPAQAGDSAWKWRNLSLAQLPQRGGEGGEEAQGGEGHLKETARLRQERPCPVLKAMKENEALEGAGWMRQGHPAREMNQKEGRECLWFQSQFNA